MTDSKIIFSNARNGETTCSCEGKFFHSSYNPQAEAQKFVSSINLDFNPSCLIIIEPALSYCADFLREQFPGIKLYAIRISQDFSQYDSKWDQVIYYTPQNFAQILFNKLGEELLLSAGIFAWTGSANIYNSLLEDIWTDIKNAVLTSRSVLYTRSGFANRWFLNTLSFINKVSNTVLLNKIDSDILITASGPSLKSSLEKIKTYRNNFYLMAVSSSLPVLLKNNIFPDMVVSTDGGWWAKKHLECALNYKKELAGTVFALSDEAACPSKILTDFKISPLCYAQSTGEMIFKTLNLPFNYAFRNGTVSGTAANLALSLTDKNVYFAGLDLCPGTGFQHTNPNSLETRSSSFDFRIKNKESRLTASRFNSYGSLEIYRNWFKTQNSNFYSRLKRLSSNYIFTEDLKPVQDTDWKCVTFSQNRNNVNFKDVSFKPENAIGKIKEIISSEESAGELFPLEAVLLKRCRTDEEKSAIFETIKEKSLFLAKKAERILNG